MNRVFREEKKYLISLPEALQACHRLAQVMHEDPHNGISGYPVRARFTSIRSTTGTSTKRLRA